MTAIARLTQVRRKAGLPNEYEHDNTLILPYSGPETIETMKNIAQAQTISSSSILPRWKFDTLYWRDEGRGSAAYDNPKFWGIIKWQIAVFELPSDSKGYSLLEDKEVER